MLQDIKNYKSIFIVMMIGIMLLWTVYMVAPSFAGNDDIDSLKQQIEKLQKRVDELESEKAPAKNKRGLWGTGFDRSWDPMADIARMQKEMDRMFQHTFRFGGPSQQGMFRSNIYYDEEFGLKEAKNKYIIEFDMSGLDEENIELEINKKYITISGKRVDEQTQEADNKYIASKSYASFSKSMLTPKDADITRMQTEKKGDKMIITLPKKI
jgi:HSP20 family protein